MQSNLNKCSIKYDTVVHVYVIWSVGVPITKCGEVNGSYEPKSVKQMKNNMYWLVSHSLLCMLNPVEGSTVLHSAVNWYQQKCSGCNGSVCNTLKFVKKIISHKLFDPWPYWVHILNCFLNSSTKKYSQSNCCCIYSDMVNF